MLTDILYGVWFSAAASTVAAVLTLVGALNGSPRHLAARAVLGVAVLVIAASYWIEAAAHAEQAIELRRAAGWVLWPALAWTAWSGMAYARRVRNAADRLAAVDE